MNIGPKLRERKLSNKQLIVGKFVDTSSPAKTFWPREMKICSKLIEAYGEDFLMWVTPPNFKAKSLAVYLGEWGKKFLSEQLFEFKKNIAPPSTPIVKTEAPEGDKIGEDTTIASKPKTLKDFLNLFQ
jgi:hypothetical protein